MNKPEVYIGSMDRRIEIIKRNKSRSSTGAETYTETALTTVWANKKLLKSDEALDDKEVTINEHQYIIRYDPIIANEKIQHLFIRDHTDEFEIYGVEEIQRKKFFKIDCEKRE
ncbi:head-tail adaptor protein [Aquimarina sp. Aq78]|uniref:phage head completion protein n=1 Tax=Aquimarina sp. Aq78 TaxID=1191889 RepID=UPI000D110BE6|nr:head-tail adaptor protein [Aquimarina sp. Aq78]